MIKTIKKNRKKINELSPIIEIVNPLESKSLFGGCDYCDNPFAQHWYGGWFNGTDIIISETQWQSSGPTPPAGGGYNDYAGYGGGDTGGGAGSPGGDLWVDTNGDGVNDYFEEISLPNLPAVVPRQFYPGGCVPANASFVAGYLGSPQTMEDMMHEYGLTHNMDANQEQLALFNGLGVDQQVAFLLQQFNMTGVRTIADMTIAIDNHHPVLAATIDQNGNGHEVTIVGYDNATNFFKIYDSYSGSYQYLAYADVSLNILSWEITGVKP